jgi:hypothetical protein
MSFNYDNMSNTTAYTSILVGKASYFDATCYNQWKHYIKIIYTLFHPRYDKLFIIV